MEASGGLFASFLKMFSETTPEGGLVNFFIWGAFAYGLWHALKHSIKLDLNFAELRSAKESLAKQSSPRASSVAELFSLLGWGPDLTPKTEIQRCVVATYKLGASGRAGVQVLAEVSSLRQNINLQIPRYLVSILVLLGLAGTVWGLHGIIQEAGRALLGESASLQSLKQALEPMKMAFSCTFTGIIASIFLSLALNFVERKQDRFDSELGEFLVSDILTVIRREESPGAALPAMREVLEKSRNFIEQFAEAAAEVRDVFAQVIRQAVHDAASEMLGSIEQMRKVSEEMTTLAASLENYRNALQADRETYQRLLLETRDATKDFIRIAVEPIASLAEEVKAEAVELRGLRDDLVKDRESWENKYRSIIEQDRQAQEQIISRVQDEAISLVKEAVKPFQSLTEKLGSTGEELAKLRDELAAERQGWETSFHDRLSDIYKAVSPLGELAQKIREESAQMIGNFSGIVQEQTETQRDIAQTLSDVSARLAPASIKTRDGKQLQQVLEQFEESNTQLRKGMERLLIEGERTVKSIQAVAARQEEISRQTLMLLKQVLENLQAPIWTKIFKYPR
jgi:methyl-accepting chemotaxis protein